LFRALPPRVAQEAIPAVAETMIQAAATASTCEQ
jgi:hypothetical protein